MSALAGYLYPSGDGFRTLCPECASQRTTYAGTNIETGTELTPVFPENLGRYQQHCSACGVSINPLANPHFPELFDGTN